MKQKLIFFLSVFLFAQWAFADIGLNSLFSDGMVVQRESVIPVWGWADPGEKISIKASWGAEANAVAGAQGKWKASLKTPKAGGPFSLTFSGKNSITISNVLSGEVWLCSGQSNMDFTFHKLTRRDAWEAQYQPLVDELKKEIETANDDLIRYIAVPETPSLFEKVKNFEGSWASAVAPAIKDVTAVGYYFAKELRKEVDVPVGIIDCNWGGTRIQPWISEATYMGDEEMKSYFEEEKTQAYEIMAKYTAENYVDSLHIKEFAEWEANCGKTPRPWPRAYPTKDKQLPATLFNGMISSVAPYAIKGALWYQGESNGRFMDDQYGKYLTKLVANWRQVWGQGDFPFYWVQLAAYEQQAKRSNYGFARVNDEMRRTLEVPNTGMVVTLDIGEAKDIHPHNKYEVGRRLSLWALEHTYGIKVPAVSGPLYKRHEIKDGKIIIEFDQVGTGIMVGNKLLQNETLPVDSDLCWFEIAAEDGKWKWAKTKIIAENQLEAWHEDIPKPVKLRYAWSSNPEGANLYNKEGLPASIFTTEE